jgi:dTDP-L-rhamnose 4-epimerase
LNVGSGQPTSVEQVALFLGESFGAKAKPLISGQYRLGDIRHGYADLTAIRACLQFAPKISLAEGLTRFVEWVKTQPVEPNRLDQATAELMTRGLMAAHSEADVREDIPAQVNAKTASA